MCVCVFDVLFFHDFSESKIVCCDHILSIFWCFNCPFSNIYIKFGVGVLPLLNIGANQRK